MAGSAAASLIEHTYAASSEPAFARAEIAAFPARVGIRCAAKARSPPRPCCAVWKRLIASLSGPGRWSCVKNPPAPAGVTPRTIVRHRSRSVRSRLPTWPTYGRPAAASPAITKRSRRCGSSAPASPPARPRASPPRGLSATARLPARRTCGQRSKPSSARRIDGGKRRGATCSGWSSLPRPLKVADSVHRERNKGREQHRSSLVGSPMRHQFMRSPRAPMTSITRRMPSIAGPSSSLDVPCLIGIISFGAVLARELG
jgi:hypothetical protein